MFSVLRLLEDTKNLMLTKKEDLEKDWVYRELNYFYDF